MHPTLHKLIHICAQGLKRVLEIFKVASQPLHASLECQL